MENASKALIIAGAILLSILIIALGVFIFNQSKSAMGNVGLSDQEVAAFNSKWESYKGVQIGSSVRALVTQVNNYNRTCNDDRYIRITSNTQNSTSTNTDFSNKNTVTTGNTIQTSSYPAGSSYEISFNYTTGGLISEINIRKIN